MYIDVLFYFCYPYTCVFFLQIMLVALCSLAFAKNLILVHLASFATSSLFTNILLANRLFVHLASFATSSLFANILLANRLFVHLASFATSSLFT